MKAGFLGFIGQPNAGKSTLMNLLVEEKVSIVTPKPQTTRRRVIGILSRPEVQVVIVDAPGIVRSKTGLNSFLEKEAVDVIGQSDALCAILNLDEDKKENLDRILELVTVSKKPWMAVITKVDLSDKIHRRERLLSELKEKYPDVRVLEVSKDWGNDLNGFRDTFTEVAAALLPESKAPLYDLELYTPHTLRDLVAELIRERCFEELQQELPYNLAIRIAKFDESDKKMARIYAEIVISKENHKPIVIGKGGAVIKKIGTKAREEIEKLLNQKVFLKLDVQVREEWFTNERMMKELGYVVGEH